MFERARIPARLAIGIPMALALVASLMPASHAQARACSGVRLTPSMDLQAAVSARPRGTTFCLREGTYFLRASLRPKQGHRFVAQGRVVFDGSRGQGPIHGFTNSAFYVTVRGLEIRNFEVGIKAARGWRIIRNNIHHNRTEGARLVTGTVFRGNHTHHNTLGGVQGYGEGIKVVGNEIDHNQSDTSRCSQKFVWADHLVYRRNHVHHNRCPAVWVDISSYRPVIARNVVEDNRGPGIDCEISYRCLIRRNVVRDNGGGIIVSSTPGARVFRNRIKRNSGYSIKIQQQGTPQGPRRDHASSHGPHITRNNWIGRNRISLSGGFVGVTKYGAVGDHVFSRKANNRFQANRFTVTSPSVHFRWRYRRLDWKDWRAAGHDRRGSLKVINRP